MRKSDYLVHAVCHTFGCGFIAKRIFVDKPVQLVKFALNYLKL